MINIELWEKRKKELNLTFDELSTLSGIPKRTILGIFRKEVQTPRIDTVQAIEKALGLSRSGWTDEERAQGIVETINVPLTAQEDEIITLVRELTQKHGKNIQDIIIAVLEKMA